jgi:glutamyl-tRNA synthetase
MPKKTETNIEKVALKHALSNAVQHGGRADGKAVLGKVLSESPDSKKDVKGTISIVNSVVEKVNAMPAAEQEKGLKKFKMKKKERSKDAVLSQLQGAEKGKVVMRLAPYPSGPLHIGNARMAILNDEYVKRYGGKLILVFDDTIGSEDKFVVPEGYDLIKEGLDWLGVKYGEVKYKSERMVLFYEYAERLIKKDIAYVCLCTSDVLRGNRKDGLECEHRKQSTEENLRLWERMLQGKYKAGEASVRLKTDMKHPNPAFRDRVLLRISDRPHPRVGNKYHVWPMLEFSWAVDDYELGMTHILRGKDLVMEDMMEIYVWEKLGIPKEKIPKFLHYGMLKLEEAKLSKSRARAAIEEGTMSGWEDPRTWSLQSLRKRGILPEAVRNFIIRMGMSLADVSVPAEILYAENRKLVDSKADRYFAVMDPVRISIEGTEKSANKGAASAPLHPEFPERGQRSIPITPAEVYIEKEDLKKLEGNEVGLIGLFSVKLGMKADFISDSIKMESPKVQWVSVPNVKVRIVMPDGAEKEVLAEPDIKNTKDGDIIQLVRIGFCRVEKDGEGRVLYFAHK